jgi:hypothetical protein
MILPRLVTPSSPGPLFRDGGRRQISSQDSVLPSISIPILDIIKLQTKPPQRLGDQATISMNLTPPAVARSPGTTETPSLRQSLEIEHSETPLHRNAKGEYSNLVWVRPGLEVSAATMGHLPQKATDVSIRQPSNPVMNQLSNAFAATTLDGPQLSMGKSKGLSRKKWRQRKQLAKTLLQEAASAAMSPEKRAKKSAKRKAKNLRKKEKNQKKSIKRSRRWGKALAERGETCRGHSRSSCLSQIIQDDQGIQGQDLERCEDVEEEDVDTRSTDVQYSPDERLERAMQALHKRKSMGRHRKVRNMPAREQKDSEDLYELGGNTDTIMD